MYKFSLNATCWTQVICTWQKQQHGFSNLQIYNLYTALLQQIKKKEALKNFKNSDSEILNNFLFFNVNLIYFLIIFLPFTIKTWYRWTPLLYMIQKEQKSEFRNLACNKSYHLRIIIKILADREIIISMKRELCCFSG